MELSSVPEALVTSRAARDKMKGKSEGKGEPVVSFWKGQGEVAKTQLSQTFAGEVSCEKVDVNVSRCGQGGHWASFLPVQICVSIQIARILSYIFDVLLSMRTSQFLLLSLARFIQHAQLVLKKCVVL